MTKVYRHMKNHSLDIILILGTLILTSIACSLGGITISGDTATIDITLTENQVNRIMEHSTSNTVVNGEELMTEVSKVEFYDGFIRTYGIMRNAAGEEVSGSMDISFSVADDLLAVEIISVDFPGITLDDPRIVEANQALAHDLAESVTESNGEVKFIAADVSEKGLHLKIEAKTRQ